MDERAEQADWLRSTAGVRRLDDMGIRVRGSEARAWLNGQVTNQVAFLEPGGAVYTLLVTVKGRVVSDAWVLGVTAEELWLIVPGGERDTLRAHLERYLVMEDVDLEPLPRVVLSVQGPASAEVVGDRPSWPCGRLGAAGRDLVLEPSEADAVEAALDEAARAVGGGPVDAAGWELARLRAGRPAYPDDLSEGVYPQEAGIKALAVSFDKGCYVGQEVVCMLESRGQLRRHLARLESADEPPAGAPLRLGEASVGELRSRAYDPAARRWLSLGYVKRAHAAPGTALDAGGVAATVLEVVAPS